MMLKKRIISFLLVLSVFAMIPIHAEAISDEEVKAPAAILMEAGTGKVLYEKNPDEKRPAASITKVMTLLLVMEPSTAAHFRWMILLQPAHTRRLWADRISGSRRAR